MTYNVFSGTLNPTHLTGKTCLVPRSEEFECQGQGHHGQKRHFWPFLQPECSFCVVKHL